MSADSSPKKNKNILNSSFTLSILSKLFSGYRPAQIADQLGVTPQDIYYHTEKMIEADLIYKDTSNGIKWKLTEKGTFILKQKATGSVNSFNSYQTVRIIPSRLDNLSFAFKISSPIPEDPHLDWTGMKNGVSKCSLKYETHSCTAEIKRKQEEDEYKAWIDSSNGAGELETNDDEYAFDYLMMPKTVREIANMTMTIIKHTTGYERCYHPSFTVNN